jgi:UDP-4-amino-4-deoxy-L-arabinose formyltransferase/UDP-glucuronic acid dehydrogenase (UDP-4-keto-hexauronic acid decarboxylating)
VEKPAEELFNLVRAVTPAVPRRLLRGGRAQADRLEAEVVKGNEGQAPGRVISVDPLRIACGEDSLVITAGQRNDNGLYLSGPQLANELGLVDGSVLRGAESGRGRVAPAC